MIKAIIFDIDGVLLDSLTIWKDLGKRYLTSLGIIPEEGLSQILFSMSMEEGAAYMVENYLPDQSPEALLIELAKLIEKFYFNEVPVKKGVIDFLLY